MSEHTTKKQASIHVFDHDALREASLASMPKGRHYNPEIVNDYLEMRHRLGLEAARSYQKLQNSGR